MDNCKFVLVRPQLGENIGTAARGMWNFGFRQLYLVHPRHADFPSERAISAASGAGEEVFAHTTITPNLATAVADCHLIIACTARKREQAMAVITPKTAGERIQYAIQNNQRVAVVFGAERAGLTNDEVSQAHFICTYPVNPQFSSLNLATAVALMAYQIHESITPAHDPEFYHETAPNQVIDYCVNRIINLVEERGFFKSPEMKPVVSRNIRNMLTRGKMSEQEIRTLHGVITTLINEK